MKEYLKEYKLKEDTHCSCISGGGNIFRKGEIVHTIRKVCVLGKYQSIYIIKDEDKDKFIEVTKSKKEQLKTYKERADYLSFINPCRKDFYDSIAEFFGKEEIPPKFKTKR